jgi:hypothetical protein
MPLRLFRCTECGNAQLDYIVSGADVYHPGYSYRSGITRELREYQEAMASDLIPKLGLARGSLVVDIGSNQETQLTGFKKFGMKELGTEPTTSARSPAKSGWRDTQTESSY